MASTQTHPSPARHEQTSPRAPGGPAAADDLPPVGPLRRSLATFAVLTTVPYLVLKIAWLAGSPVGLTDPGFGASTAMVVLNSLTAALDVVALALAVLLLVRRGLRAPTWLILPPLWVGAGLLGQILVMLPVQLVRLAVDPPEPTTELPPIEAWVFVMVYAGFAGLGIGLLGAFAVYAGQRWGRRAVPPVSARARTALRMAAVLAVVATLVHVLLSDVDPGTRLVDLAIGGVAAGSLVALSRPGAGRASVVLVFVGTGALAAWGTYLGVVTMVPNELVVYDGTDWTTATTSALRALAGIAGVGALIVRLRGR